MKIATIDEQKFFELTARAQYRIKSHPFNTIKYGTKQAKILNDQYRRDYLPAALQSPIESLYSTEAEREYGPQIANYREMYDVFLAIELHLHDDEKADYDALKASILAAGGMERLKEININACSFAEELVQDNTIKVYEGRGYKEGGARTYTTARYQFLQEFADLAPTSSRLAPIVAKAGFLNAAELLNAAHLKDQELRPQVDSLGKPRYVEKFNPRSPEQMEAMIGGEAHYKEGGDLGDDFLDTPASKDNLTGRDGYNGTPTSARVSLKVAPDTWLDGELVKRKVTSFIAK